MFVLPAEWEADGPSLSAVPAMMEMVSVTYVHGWCHSRGTNVPGGVAKVNLKE